MSNRRGSVQASLSHQYPVGLLAVFRGGLMGTGLLLFCLLSTSPLSPNPLWRELLFGMASSMCLLGLVLHALLSLAPTKTLNTKTSAHRIFGQIGGILTIVLLFGLCAAHIRVDVAAARASSITLVQADDRLPAALRQAIITQWFPPQMHAPPDESELLQMTEEHPSWQASREELTELSGQMTQTFDGEEIHPSASRWVLAAALPTVGLSVCVAFLIAMRQRRFDAESQGASWEAMYFFSRSGVITSRTIQQYLAAQQVAVPQSAVAEVWHKRRCFPLPHAFQKARVSLAPALCREGWL